MKSKGFTLIELLAVIVILAIIALIATPIVMNIIENAKKSSLERSAENYLRAVETAIVEAKLDGSVTDGIYKVNSDGDLCLSANSSECLQVEISGTTAEVNSKVSIADNIIQDEGTEIIIDNQVISYDSNGELNSRDYTTCVAVNGRKEVLGSEFVCDPGDGVERTFYVLEKGNNPVTNSTLATDEFALIASENIGDTVIWGNSGDQTPTVALPYLQGQTSGWTDVEVTMPTHAQLYTALMVTTVTLNNSKAWLYNNLDNIPSTDMAYGYWTSTYGDTVGTAWSLDVSSASNILVQNGLSTTVNNKNKLGIRPVIVVNVSDIYQKIG